MAHRDWQLLEEVERFDKRASRWVIIGLLLLLALAYAIPRIFASIGSYWTPDLDSSDVFWIEAQWFASDRMTRVRWMKVDDVDGWHAKGDDGKWYLFYFDPELSDSQPEKPYPF